tara:strand:- start:60 stop:233 length:174 start_codon:yes stop_codon:yes gene_type:complete
MFFLRQIVTHRTDSKGADCSFIGSAQQYQGSSKKGMVVREGCTGNVTELCCSEGLLE